MRKKVANLRSFDERPLHFGFLIGFNTMDFQVYNNGVSNAGNDFTPIYGEVVHLQPGLNIGIVSSYKLREHLNLRFLPGISFGQRDVYYIDETGEELSSEVSPLKVKSTFLEFPLLVKYNASYNFV